MKKVKKFAPTEEQEKAFKAVARAIKKVRKLGLVFYGKSGSLVAYTTQADEYIQEDFEDSLSGGHGQIECISKMGLISDSGTDDYGCYRSPEDEEKYGGY